MLFRCQVATGINLPKRPNDSFDFFEGQGTVIIKALWNPALLPYTVLLSNSTMRSLTKRPLLGCRNAASNLCWKSVNMFESAASVPPSSASSPSPAGSSSSAFTPVPVSASSSSSSSFASSFVPLGHKEQARCLWAKCDEGHQCEALLSLQTCFHFLS